MPDLPETPGTSEASDSRWQRLEEIFHEAAALRGDRRLEYLDRACETYEMRREVESLLVFDGDEETRVEAAVAGAVYAAAEELEEEAPEGVRELVEMDFEGIRPGDRIGTYRIVRVLGRGGLSTVYLAERADDQYHQRVALKLVRRGMATAHIRERLRQERQILANLDHPNVARLLDGGTTDDGLPYFVMEHIEGRDLETFCDEARLTIQQRLEIFCQLCSAVDAAHRNLIVHRDIKPGNILVTEDGVPKLLDFGIAKLLDRGAGLEAGLEAAAPTATGQQLLTPPFASPEQVRGEALTTATDVYSLGVVLYRLLAGRHPYSLSGQSSAEVERTISRTEPRRPSLALEDAEAASSASGAVGAAVAERRGESPDGLRRRLEGDLDTIVLKALRKEPERRYRSARELAEDIRRHLRGRPVTARPDTLSYRGQKFLRRHRLAMTTAVSVAAVIAALVLFYTLRLAKERDRARREAAKAERVTAMMVQLFEVSTPEQSRGEEVTARELLDRGAEQVRRELAAEPEVLATMMNVMGTVYRSLGLYNDAQPLLEEALAIRRRQHGENHEEVAETLNDLAELFYDTGSYDQAAELTRRALEVRRRLLGPEHPETLTTLSNLGVFLYVQGDLQGAEDVFRETLEQRRDLPEPDRGGEATSLNNLASVLEDLGNLEEAEALYREALAIKSGLKGQENPDVAAAMNNLAALLERRQQPGEAGELYQRALEIHRKLVGDDFPDVAVGLERLGKLAIDRGETGRAESLLKEAVVLRRRAEPPDPVWMARLLLRLGKLLAEGGRHGEAEPLLREGLSLAVESLAADHWRIAEYKSLLGACRLAQGDPAAARPLLEEGLAGLEAARGPDDPRTRAARSRLEGLAGLSRRGASTS